MGEGYAQLVHPQILMTFEKPEYADILRNLIKVTYEESVDSAASLSIELSNGGEYLEDERLQVNKHIWFRIGYADRMSPMNVLTIKEIHPKFPETGIIGLTIKAFDLSTMSKDSTTPKNWGKLPSSEIVKQIAARYGYDADVAPSRDTPSKDRIQPGKTTDMQFCRELAVKLGWDCYVEGTMLVFKPQAAPGTPHMVFQYLGDPTSIFRSFSPHVKAWRPPDAASAGADDKKKKPHGSSAEEASQKVWSANLNKHTAVITNKKRKKEAAPGESNPGVKTNTDKASTIRPSAEPDAHKQAAQDAQDAKSKKAEIDADAELVGQPDIALRQTVLFKGLGTKWSGTYRVATFTHEYSIGGFTTSGGLARSLGPAGGAGASSSKNGKKGAADGKEAATRRVYKADLNWHKAEVQVKGRTDR
jgi:phage protein D